jgi:anti-anti-sigma factor
MYGEFKQSRGPGYLLLTVAGEIDLVNVASLCELLDAAADGNDAAVILSLAGATYFDSRTIEALAQFFERMEVTRRRLSLVVPQRSAARTILEVSGILPGLPMYETAESAVDAERTPQNV